MRLLAAAVAALVIGAVIGAGASAVGVLPGKTVTSTTTATTTATESVTTTTTMTLIRTFTFSTTTTVTETPGWCKETLIDEQIDLDPGEGRGSAYYLEGAPGPGEVKLTFTATGNVSVSVSQIRFNPEYMRVGRTITGTSGILWMPIAQGIPITISINNNGELPAMVEVKATYYYVCPPPTETPPTQD